MLGQNNNMKFTNFLVVTPSFQAQNNCQKFLIMNLLRGFCQNHFSKKENYKILLAKVKYEISNNTINHLSRKICFH